MRKWSVRKTSVFFTLGLILAIWLSVAVYFNNVSFRSSESKELFSGMITEEGVWNASDSLSSLRIHGLLIHAIKQAVIHVLSKPDQSNQSASVMIDRGILTHSTLVKVVLNLLRNEQNDLMNEYLHSDHPDPLTAHISRILTHGLDCESGLHSKNHRSLRLPPSDQFYYERGNQIYGHSIVIGHFFDHCLVTMNRSYKGDITAFDPSQITVTQMSDLLSVNDPLGCVGNHNDSHLRIERIQTKSNRWTNLLISGLYNTGTNNLLYFFHFNCLDNHRQSGYTSIEYQVPWKKHSQVSREEILSSRPFRSYIRNKLILVIIKDPLTWMKSWCKARYYIIPLSKRWYKSGQCPTGIRQSRVWWHNQTYPTVLHIWNDWYQSWLDLNQGFNNRDRKQYFPFLLIRFEDLLFKPKLMNRLICDECVHGKRRNHDLHMDKPVKYHGNSRNRTEALKTYSDPQYRFKGFSEEDLILARKTLNSTLLDLFNYNF